MSTILLGDLRRLAIANSLSSPTTLSRAIQRMGFVQADPIRAPARAQDLILRHRVKNYRAGDLEKRYAQLDIEEDFFINYGFLPRAIQALMHPRIPSEARTMLTAATKKRMAAILEFVQAHEHVHPRDVDAHFAHGRAVNAWGGSSNASTRLLDSMHYRGMLRIVKRERGIRLYAAAPIRETLSADERRAALDTLIDIVINQYAPMPASGFASTVGRLRYGAPQWRGEMAEAIKRAKSRLNHTKIDGVDWYWPKHLNKHLNARNAAPDNALRLLAPFDPIVWDRKRFEHFWGWAYRFEAYTPAPKRKLGYYALPMLWRDVVIGWANVRDNDGVMETECGYVAGRAPKDKAFRLALEEECERMRGFLAVD
jgi:uncharacterized protein